MKINKSTIILITSLLLFLTSCSNSEQNKKIAGEWTCASWINKSTNEDKCNDNVYFKFSQDGTYQSVLGSVKDAGEFKIRSETLYVTPNEKMEFAVKIEKLTADSLVLLMNLAGEEEILTLASKK